MIFVRTLILVILLPITGWSQTYFNKKFDFGGSEWCQSILQANDTTYIGVSNSGRSNFQSFIIHKQNALGDTIKINEIKIPYVQYFTGRNSLAKMQDGNFIIAATLIDSSNKNYSLLVKFDINCDTLWMKSFPSLYYIAGRDCYETKEKEIIVTGDVDINNNGKDDSYLIKTDSIGNLKWMKTYNSIYNDYDVAVCCLQTLDGGYIMSGCCTTGPGASSNWIVKTDSAGTLKWQKDYGFGFDDGLSWITQMPDSNYVCVGSRDYTNNNKHAILRKLNKVGNAIWTKEFVQGPICNLTSEPIILPNNDIAIGGQAYTSFVHSQGFLLKTDALGNELWRRIYSLSGLDHYTSDARKTSDNGFVLCGQAPDNSGDTWIIKVDSFGCEVAGCDGVGINEFNNVQDGLMFNVFPNPSDGKISFEMNEEIENPLIEITDLTGKLIFTEKKLSIQKTFQINLEHLENGFYFLKLKGKNGNLKGVQKFLIQK